MPKRVNNALSRTTGATRLRRRITLTKYASHGDAAICNRRAADDEQSAFVMHIITLANFGRNLRSVPVPGTATWEFSPAPIRFQGSCCVRHGEDAVSLAGRGLPYRYFSGNLTVK